MSRCLGGRGGVRIFEDAGFIGDAKQVFVCGPAFGSGLLDGDVLVGSACEEGLATGKAVAELWWVGK